MKLEFCSTGEDLKNIKKSIETLYEKIKKLFGVEIENMTICVHETRNKFEEQLERKTETWEVANADYNRRIDILHPEAFEKESNHSKDEFMPMLGHEITHLFVDELSRGKAVPKWLDEGLASYFSGQYKDRVKQKGYYVEENFCEKLGTPRGWDNNSNYYAYQIASLFVYFLIKTYSFEKIKELILTLDNNYYYPNFQKIFNKTFNKSIESLEQKFIKESI